MNNMNWRDYNVRFIGCYAGLLKCEHSVTLQRLWLYFYKLSVRDRSLFMAGGVEEKVGGLRKYFDV